MRIVLSICLLIAATLSGCSEVKSVAPPESSSATDATDNDDMNGSGSDTAEPSP